MTSAPKNEELIPDPRNARKHGARNQDLIRQSLEEVGAFRSIAVDGDNVVRAGNGVLEQAQALGLRVRVIDAAPDELIAVRRPDLRGQQAERAALFDNRTAETSEWEVDVLELIAQESPQVVEGVFDGGELAALIQQRDDLNAVHQQLAQNAAEARARGLGAGKLKIRPVLSADELGTFELALRATGNSNRASALVQICREYLNAKGITEGQLDACTQSLLAQIGA